MHALAADDHVTTRASTQLSEQIDPRDDTQPDVDAAYLGQHLAEPPAKVEMIHRGQITETASVRRP